MLSPLQCSPFADPYTVPREFSSVERSTRLFCVMLFKSCITFAFMNLKLVPLNMDSFGKRKNVDKTTIQQNVMLNHWNVIIRQIPLHT